MTGQGQGQDRGNGAPLAREVNTFLGVVLAGLDVPLPVHETDNLAYYRLLDTRTMWCRSILRRIVDRGVGSAALDLGLETSMLRDQLRRYPPSYQVAPSRPEGAPGGWPLG